MSREGCQGCPIEECRVEVDGLCNRCDDVEDWLAEHDLQIINEIFNKIEELPTYSFGVSMLSADNYKKSSDLVSMLEQMKVRNRG